MLYNIVTVFLMTTALMPPAILQYYAFEPLLKHRQKVLVLGGYAVLYLMELIFFLYMFVWGPWEHSFILYKKVFVIAWIPHFLWAVVTIRPYVFLHLYVFSIRAACTIFVHTLMALILPGRPCRQPSIRPNGCSISSATWPLCPCCAVISMKSS